MIYSFLFRWRNLNFNIFLNFGVQNYKTSSDNVLIDSSSMINFVCIPRWLSLYVSLTESARVASLASALAWPIDAKSPTHNWFTSVCLSASKSIFNLELQSKRSVCYLSEEKKWRKIFIILSQEWGDDIMFWTERE